MSRHQDRKALGLLEWGLARTAVKTEIRPLLTIGAHSLHFLHPEVDVETNSLGAEQKPTCMTSLICLGGSLTNRRRMTNEAAPARKARLASASQPGLPQNDQEDSIPPVQDVT
jgi:hypothetical protein